MLCQKGAPPYLSVK